MKVDRITLFAVPFDNSYKSVLTPRTRLEKITRPSILSSISLQREVTPLTIWLTSKAFKYINGKITISIDKLDADLIKYNYAILYEDVNPTYYFITGINSLNSGIKPSTELMLERDVWANNDEAIRSNQTYRVFSRGHNYLLKVMDGSVKNLTGPNQYPDYAKNYSPFSVKNRFEVLWLKMTVDDARAYSDKSSGTTIANLHNLYYDDGTYPHILQPALIFDRINENFLDPSNNDFRITFTQDGVTWHYQTDAIPDLNAINDTHILKCELTYCAPFEVNFELTPDGYYEATVDNINYTTLYTTSEHIQISVNKIVWGRGQYTDYNYYNYESYTVNANSYVYHSYPHFLQMGEIQIDDPHANNYPLCYKSIYVNGKMENLIRTGDIVSTEVRFYRFRNNPCYEIIQTDRDGNTYHNRKTPVHGTGSILTTSSAYDEYLRNNGNQTIAAAVQNILYTTGGAAATLSGGATIGIPSMLRGVNGLINQATKLDDLTNMQDNISAPQYDAAKHAFYQDIICYYNATMEPVRWEACAIDAHAYGSNTGFVQNINEPMTTSFRYVQIPDADLPISNLNDKRIIDQILADGTRMWYYYDSIVDYSNALSALSNLDIEISNDQYAPG